MYPAKAGSTLKGKRKKKADTNDGPTDKTAQGGGQTDLQNPTTHYRRARGIKGIIKDQWGYKIGRLGSSPKKARSSRVTPSKGR